MTTDYDQLPTNDLTHLVGAMIEGEPVPGAVLLIIDTSDNRRVILKTAQYLHEVLPYFRPRYLFQSSILTRDPDRLALLILEEIKRVDGHFPTPEKAALNVFSRALQGEFAVDPKPPYDNRECSIVLRHSSIVVWRVMFNAPRWLITDYRGAMFRAFDAEHAHKRKADAEAEFYRLVPLIDEAKEAEAVEVVTPESVNEGLKALGLNPIQPETEV